MKICVSLLLVYLPLMYCAPLSPAKVALHESNPNELLIPTSIAVELIPVVVIIGAGSSMENTVIFRDST